MVPGLYNTRELSVFPLSPDMFQWRGGWRYAVTEVRLQALFYKMVLSAFFSLLKNVCIRLVTRLLLMACVRCSIRGSSGGK